MVTRVALEHLEFFSSIDEIALAERELIENLPWPNATAVLNADDERVAQFAESGARARDSLRRQAAGGVSRGKRSRSAASKARHSISSRPPGARGLHLPLIGRHNVMNALAALAAASVWGIGAEEAKRVFPTLKPADKRGEVVRFEDGFTVINDCYNSSPTALNALTHLLAATPGYQRRILAAGEMLELGAFFGGIAPRMRAHCGAGWEDRLDFRRAGDAEDFVDAARSRRGIRRSARNFSRIRRKRRNFSRSSSTPGDLLLLKGSRGVRMERLLEAIDAQHRALARSGRARSDRSRPKGRG